MSERPPGADGPGGGRGGDWLAARPAEVLPAGPFTLRRVVPDHAAEVAAAVAASREHLRPWMPWVVVHDLDGPAAARGFATGVHAAWDQGVEFAWGVWDDEVLVGVQGLHTLATPGRVEIGYWTHADHVGRHVARLAAAALTREALRLPGVTHVEVHHDEANHASARVPAHLGFRWAGTIARDPGVEGGCSDTTVVWVLGVDDVAGAPVEHLGLPAG